MLATLKSYFQVPPMCAWERWHRQQILSRLLWTEFAVALAIGLVNLRLGAIVETTMLFTTALACIPAMLLNSRGHYEAAAGIATFMVLATLDLTLYEAGGIHDAAVVTIPMFVMLGALLFTRRSLPFFVAAALGSVLFLGAMELSRGAPTEFTRTLADIIVISLLTLASGLIVWVTVESLEGNLDRAHQSEREVRQAYDLTLQGWAKALEYRDEETHGHARRVVALCMRLAEEWNFSEEQMAQIRRGALLHDIGKMAVPDSILLKPGALDEGERELMKTHPLAAGKMLADIPYLQPALNIPACHHENWDGSGYPRGWAGTQIPIEARIFAVVDHFDALESDRPYRKAWPREKILQYIEENSGRKFDPEVCRAFTRLYHADAFAGLL